jgi:hypothetical protein
LLTRFLFIILPQKEFFYRPNVKMILEDSAPLASNPSAIAFSSAFTSSSCSLSSLCRVFHSSLACAMSSRSLRSLWTSASSFPTVVSGVSVEDGVSLDPWVVVEISGSGNCLRMEEFSFRSTTLPVFWRVHGLLVSHSARRWTKVAR